MSFFAPRVCQSHLHCGSVQDALRWRGCPIEPLAGPFGDPEDGGSYGLAKLGPHL